MNSASVLQTLTTLHPRAKIVCLPADNPSEIICETDPTSLHSDWSEAIAIIDQSVPHMHLKTVETYIVLDGQLEVIIENTSIKLTKGETLTIPMGAKHFAKGKETWVRVLAKPGWTPEDHILV